MERILLVVCILVIITTACAFPWEAQSTEAQAEVDRRLATATPETATAVARRFLDGDTSAAYSDAVYRGYSLDDVIAIEADVYFGGSTYTSLWLLSNDPSYKREVLQSVETTDDFGTSVSMVIHHSYTHGGTQLESMVYLRFRVVGGLVTCADSATNTADLTLCQ